MRPHFKPIPPDDSKLFRAVIQETEKEFDYPWHYHPEYELIHIQRCHGTRYVGNSIENFFDDDLVLIGSNLPHCWINTAGQEQSARAVVVYLKPEFVDETWMQSVEFESIRNLLALSAKGIKFEQSVALRLKDKFNSLFAAHSTSLGKLMVLLTILQELAQTNEFHLLCEQGFSYELNPTHNDRINIVYKYIETHYLQKISLADIAAQVHMSEEYFSRFFTKVMKKPFFEFLIEYKINRACKLLIETDMQINQVCYASGFESVPFFYRQFKKFKACQPSQYRLNYQKASL